MVDVIHGHELEEAILRVAAAKNAKRTLKRLRKVVRRAQKESAKRVAMGHALLQERLPGWTDKISIPELNLGSGERCVLGQLYARRAFVDAGIVEEDDFHGGSYSDAQDALGIAGEDYGFDIFDEGDETPGDAVVSGDLMYEILNDLWHKAIVMTKNGEEVTKDSLLDGLVI